MVRRGSAVRVRKRALQKPRKRGFCVQIDLRFVERAAGVDLVVEQSVLNRTQQPTSKDAKDLSERGEAEGRGVPMERSYFAPFPTE